MHYQWIVCDGSSREEHISARFVEKELSNDATLTNRRQIEDTDNWSSLYHQPGTFCLFGWLIFLWRESLPVLPKTKTRVLHSRGSVCEVWADVAEVVDKAASTLYWRCTVLLTTLLFQLVHPSQVMARPQRDESGRGWNGYEEWRRTRCPAAFPSWNILSK